jgi:hypothetical protein
MDSFRTIFQLIEFPESSEFSDKRFGIVHLNKYLIGYPVTEKEGKFLLNWLLKADEDYRLAEDNPNDNLY